MANSETENQIVVDDDFVTVSVDGWYSHFQEGFLSLVFYRNKAIPKTLNGDKVDVKRVMLFETRLPLSSVERLIDDLSHGAEMYSKLSLFHLTKDRDFWSGEHQPLPASEFKTLNEKREDVEGVTLMTIMQAAQKLSPKGNEKFGKLFEDFLFEHMEDIRKIAIEDGVELGKPEPTE